MNRNTSKTDYKPLRKSDNAIVPMKPTNNPPFGGAESVEERVLTKRNASEIARARTQSRINTMSRLARVREAATKVRDRPLTALMHHLTQELLRESFYSLNRRAAKGVDGLDWKEYVDS